MKNIKYIGIIPIFILSMISPSFSDTLSNNSQCDNATLHTTTGPATLNARWTANTIILNWQPGDDATFTAPAQNDAAYSCEYDGGITLPTAPTKSGYTFGGWRVGAAAAQCVLSSYYTAIADEFPEYDAQHARWRPISQQGISMNGEFGDDSTIGNLSAGEFGVTFSTGEIRGRALCSNTPGTDWGEIGTPNETGGGEYCWCAGTDFGNSCHVASPSWVFVDAQNYSYGCAGDCASYCVQGLYEVPNFRSAIFGVPAE